MYIIRNIVGRECMVGSSPFEVCRVIYFSLTKKGRGKEFKEKRREYYKEAIKVQKENDDLYYGVMRGFK